MEKTSHEWSKDSLFAKAQLYAEVMFEHQDNNWQFGLWSAFVIEMLVRATVANVSPVLIADSKDWNNLLHALSKPTKKQKFVAKSASISELIQRVEDLADGFTREHSNFCASHVARRNSEVHSGNMPFENIGTSSWLPSFFTVCQVLASEIGESLESLFGSDIAEQAKEEIDAQKDDKANAVKDTISAHKTVWGDKTFEEQEQARKQAATVSLRHYGHRVNCPACGCTALLHGKSAGEVKKEVSDDGIIERQVMRPETFQCVACGLKINGYSKLRAADLGDTYISTSHYDAIEYFEVDLDEHIRNMMADDNNEY
ncbi:hypothetical protein [Methylomonas albis]|uniref:DUF4145 domain-containing protein n=1 Tax=Methylomonas albis TaxID=1854563 RepID=A0ABR9D4Z9_9GAMM|nr:hypothetical protein [Methylomonas albis]MBD9358189.1 hypothetical protein [Methylomonas albis]CAD6881565.1 hypothetical protein [Methylomonas albis]